MSYLESRKITLNRHAAKGGVAREYDRAMLRKLDIADGRMKLTEDEISGVVELTTAAWLLQDGSERAKRLLVKAGLWRFIRCSFGLAKKTTLATAEHINSEQTIRLCNVLATTTTTISADESSTPEGMTAINTAELKALAAQACKQCAVGCNKTRKQAKHCPIRRALLVVPGIAEEAINNPFADDVHCIFSQAGGDFE